MSRLRARVRSAGNRQQLAQQAYHPVGTGATPMVMPMALITYAPVPDYPSHGTLTYHTLYPAWNADGGVYTPSLAPRPVPGPRPAGRP